MATYICEKCGRMTPCFLETNVENSSEPELCPLSTTADPRWKLVEGMLIKTNNTLAV